jgi:hypothetical protein
MREDIFRDFGVHEIIFDEQRRASPPRHWRSSFEEADRFRLRATVALSIGKTIVIVVPFVELGLDRHFPAHEVDELMRTIERPKPLPRISAFLTVFS